MIIKVRIDGKALCPNYGFLKDGTPFVYFRLHKRLLESGRKTAIIVSRAVNSEDVSKKFILNKIALKREGSV
jgi:hypothetical protein